MSNCQIYLPKTQTANTKFLVIYLLKNVVLTYKDIKEFVLTYKHIKNVVLTYKHIKDIVLTYKNDKLTHNSTPEVMMNNLTILRWKNFALKYLPLKNI